MKKYWITQSGEEIEHKKLEDSHLLNILKWIDRRAENGILLRSGGGFDDEDLWYVEYEIKGEEVLERYDYKNLMKEAKRRKLIKQILIK